MRQLSFRADLGWKQKRKLTEYKRNEQSIGIAPLFATWPPPERMLILC